MTRCVGVRRVAGDVGESVQSRCPARRAGGIARAGHVAAVRALRELVGDERQALGRRHQNAHIAVAQDVADLLRLQQRIERHEHAPRGGRAERGDHGLEPLFEVDRNALAAREAEFAQTGSERAYARRQLAVVERIAAGNQCGRMWPPRRGCENEIVQQVGGGHR